MQIPDAKSSIGFLLLHNAFDHSRQCLAAHDEARPRDEVRHSISVHLMCALTLEALGNEAAEVVLDAWALRKIDKTDTPAKWHIVSKIGGKSVFLPSAEPIQSVQRLQAVRNRIAHPKPINLGNDIMIASKNGSLLRNPMPDHVLHPGDEIIIGFGKLLDEFNVDSARKSVQETVAAIEILAINIPQMNLNWINSFKKQFPEITRPELH